MKECWSSVLGCAYDRISTQYRSWFCHRYGNIAPSHTHEGESLGNTWQWEPEEKRERELGVVRQEAGKL